MAKTAKGKAAGTGAGAEKHDLKKYLADIKAISDWFEDQEEIDLEQALVKIREAGELIKLSKDRLVEVENEFKEIKAKIEDEE